MMIQWGGVGLSSTLSSSPRGLVLGLAWKPPRAGAHLDFQAVFCSVTVYVH